MIEKTINSTSGQIVTGFTIAFALILVSVFITAATSAQATPPNCASQGKVTICHVNSGE